MRTTIIILALLPIAAPAPAIGNTAVYMNRLQVQPEMERITSLAIGCAWEAATSAQAKQAFLWTGPNNDGNPVGAVSRTPASGPLLLAAFLAQSASGNSASPATM